MVLRSTGFLLASDGFDVCRFDNGEDFIAYVASHDVPVVVLDIWMKGMNGLEVLARLCAISPQTHVIVITGHEDAAARITRCKSVQSLFLLSLLMTKNFSRRFIARSATRLNHHPRKPSLSVPDWWASRNARGRVAPPRSGMGLKSTIQPNRKR